MNNINRAMRLLKEDIDKPAQIEHYTFKNIIFNLENNAYDYDDIRKEINKIADEDLKEQCEELAISCRHNHYDPESTGQIIVDEILADKAGDINGIDLYCDNCGKAIPENEKDLADIQDMYPHAVYCKDCKDQVLKEQEEKCEDWILEEDLNLKDVKVDGDLLKLNLNGKEYSYKSDKLSAEELLAKYNSISKYSVGKAYAWLKKHTNLVTEDIIEEWVLKEDSNNSLSDKLINIINKYLKNNNLKLNEYQLSHDYGTPNYGKSLEELRSQLDRYDIYKIMGQKPELKGNDLIWYIKCNPVYGNKFIVKITITTKDNEIIEQDQSKIKELEKEIEDGEKDLENCDNGNEKVDIQNDIKYAQDQLDKEKSKPLTESRTIDPEDLPKSLRKYAHMIEDFEKSNEYTGDNDYWCYLADPYETDYDTTTIHDTLSNIRSELRDIEKRYKESK